MDYVDSDQAFLKKQVKGTKHEMTYAGALSFLRRKYSRDLDGVDITISGIPFDGAVTNDREHDLALALFGQHQQN